MDSKSFGNLLFPTIMWIWWWCLVGSSWFRVLRRDRSIPLWCLWATQMFLSRRPTARLYLWVGWNSRMPNNVFLPTEARTKLWLNAKCIIEIFQKWRHLRTLIIFVIREAFNQFERSSQKLWFNTVCIFYRWHFLWSMKWIRARPAQRQMWVDAKME